MNWLILSFDESSANGLLDLDTGRHPNPPPKLVKSSSGHEPSGELLAWAEAQGVDLITVKITPAGSGKSYYAFRPVGMQVWRIENDRYDNIEKEVCQSTQLKLPAPWKGLIAQTDEKTGTYDDKLVVSFLFITKEGTCGAMQLKPPLNAAYTDGGLHFKFIYESPSPAADSGR